MNSRILPAWLAVVSLLLAGCLPESKNPLSTAATSTIDARLEGVYAQRQEKSDDAPAYWHFHYRGTKPGTDQSPGRTPWIEILGVSHEKASGLDIAHYRALATHLGGHDYLSFVDLGADGARKSRGHYSFARYEVNWRGDLRIWFADNSALAAAIKSGQLRGQVKVSKYATDVLLTDTTAHLAAYFAATDPAKLFSAKPMVFRRVAR